ncbi:MULTISPECIES: aromatase/cyclase [unclassified Actinopolyspora]|uniref:aromatase/cyclase n=1 Tax=unclassified Actinopolyspora TaxID=2639451 RepID=UPI0013F63E00|nr:MULTISPECIES: aromatase/cyclase [unclassified Actinopolyspora]NHD19329.1 cyclase [Actinopolyspora sp. BKK2]NHE78453.1 cyclase [Actinopolyspora sp. BKK1]
MTLDATTEVEHEITVDAKPEDIYRLIAEVENWPHLFPPSVHVEYLERGEREERIQIWATANGNPKTWVSRRELNPEALTVRFRQEVSAPPVAAMGGTWIIEPSADGGSRVRLLHDYRAVDDDPDDLAWIDQAVNRNSQAELAAMKTNAELLGNRSDLLLTFDDTVTVDGSGADVYEFLDRAERWEQRLPHVARVALTEDTPGLQTLEMDTRTKDGSTHTTKSVRVCSAPSQIVYKQTVLPALMTLHTGRWSIEETASGTKVTSRHTVAINEANVESVLGAGADVDQARSFVRTALSGNSLTTLNLAKEYAESRRH